MPYCLIPLLLLSTCLTSCWETNKVPQYGYIEARLRYISSPENGKLLELFTERGHEVKKDTLLFNLEKEPESFDLSIAKNALEEAHANLNDLEKGLRPSELDQIKAQMDAIVANLNFTKKSYERRKILLAKQLINEEAMEQILEALAVSEANLREVSAKLLTGELSAREDQILAAKARLKQSLDKIDQSAWKVSKKSVTAPDNAFVFDTYFKPGEEVAAFQPVLSLLIPKEIKAIFFVLEPHLSSLKLGQEIKILTDGAHEAITGKISYISPNAEYTPPVIYARESRQDLVYKIEAEFSEDVAKQLHPGQPIEILFPAA